MRLLQSGGCAGRRAATALVLAMIALLASCAKGAGPAFEPISPRTVAVHETLRLPLVVANASGLEVMLRYEGPELAALDSTASISGGANGEFRWTPLASHVGVHEIQFVAAAPDGTEYDRTTAVITVTPSADSAPVFIRPGAGGTFDLTRDAAVVFDIEVRDEDSLEVEIRERDPLPGDATITRDGPMSARFVWHPSPDEIAASERYTIRLEADDGDHEPTPHDYIVVLRSGPKEDCPGGAPEITIASPAEGERITSSGGFPVGVTVADDMGLRDAPLLYWTTSAPDDPSAPDVTMFEQVTFEADGAGWIARVPSIALAASTEQTVYFVVSATDNDDAMGTLCDHRTETALRSFVAVAASETGTLPRCAPCGASRECASGFCAAAAGGGRCLDACDGTTCSAGTCGSRPSVEGRVASTCGGVTEVCGGGTGSCTEDAFEDNDTLATASAGTDMLSAQICRNDPDFYRYSVTAGTRIDVTLAGFVHSAGDLDLQLLDASGRIVDSSAGTTNTEQVSYCMAATGNVTAKVLGYMGAQNAYTLRVARTSASCCADDAMEGDDTRATARAIAPGAFEGTICPGDADWLRFSISGPSSIEASIVFDDAVGDLDLELYGPDGTLLDSSRSTLDIETVTHTATTSGTYTLRVYGYSLARGDYIGDLMITASTGGCTNDFDCAVGQVCNRSACVDAACTSATSCPSGYGCPVAGPGTPTSACGAPCAYNRDCRTTDACKRFPEGRYCGRTGAGQNGARCATFADCGGQRACLPWTGGYCARAACTTAADCESGTRCVNVSGVNVCALECGVSGSSICRTAEGYGCRSLRDVDGVLQWVCVP